MNSIYWFHAHRADMMNDKIPHMRQPKLNGIKLGCTTDNCKLRMSHYASVYRFKATKLEGVEIYDFLDLKKIEVALHYELDKMYPRMNARHRLGEVFNLGDEDYDEAIPFIKEHVIDDVMWRIYSHIGEWGNVHI